MPDGGNSDGGEALADKRATVSTRSIYKVKGKTSICTAGDSTGQIIAFLLSAKRDAGGAKRSSEKAFNSSSNPIPRDIKCLALEGIETMSMIRERRIRG